MSFFSILSPIASGYPTTFRESCNFERVLHKSNKFSCVRDMPSIHRILCIIVASIFASLLWVEENGAGNMGYWLHASYFNKAERNGFGYCCNSHAYLFQKISPSKNFFKVHKLIVAYIKTYVDIFKAYHESWKHYTKWFTSNILNFFIRPLMHFMQLIIRRNMK